MFVNAFQIRVKLTVQITYCSVLVVFLFLIFIFMIALLYCLFTVNVRMSSVRKGMPLVAVSRSPLNMIKKSLSTCQITRCILRILLL
jgi:hypothetical protein